MNSNAFDPKNNVLLSSFCFKLTIKAHKLKIFLVSKYDSTSSGGKIYHEKSQERSVSTKRTSYVQTGATTPNGLRDECKAMHKRLLDYTVLDCSKAKLQKKLQVEALF